MAALDGASLELVTTITEGIGKREREKGLLLNLLPLAPVWSTHYRSTAGDRIEFHKA